MVWQLVEDLCQLMQDLPLYSTHFLSILCQLLLVYRDSCNTLYRGKEEGRGGGKQEGKGRREGGREGGEEREGFTTIYHLSQS